MYFLPQISGYIQYFDNDGKYVSFKIENYNVLVKYNEIQNEIKKTLHKKFHVKHVYDEKYIKAKAKTLNGMTNTIF